MGIGINSRQDMSYLFSNMNNKNSTYSAMSSVIGDYSSIKNGSYGKLLKAYYSESKTDAVKKLAGNKVKNSPSTQEQKSLTKVQSSTDALKKSADALLSKGSDSVFAGKDSEKIYDAVNSFVNNYNKTVDSVADSGTSTVVSRGNSMTNNTAIYAKSLAGIGITVNNDDTLSIDKDAFMKADMSKVEKLFGGNGSFGYQVSTQASFLNSAAESAANVKSTYTANGLYNNTGAGNLFNSYF